MMVLIPIISIPPLSMCIKSQLHGYRLLLYQHRWICLTCSVYYCQARFIISIVLNPFCREVIYVHKTSSTINYISRGFQALGLEYNLARKSLATWDEIPVYAPQNIGSHSPRHATVLLHVKTCLSAVTQMSSRQRAPLST